MSKYGLILSWDALALGWTACSLGYDRLLCMTEWKKKWIKSVYQISNQRHTTAGAFFQLAVKYCKAEF